MSCCNGNDNSCSAPCIAGRTNDCKNTCHKTFAPTSTTFEQSFSRSGGCVLTFDGVGDYFKLDGTVADMIPESTMDDGWSIEAWIRFDKAGQTEYPGSTVFGTTCGFNNVFIQDSVMRYYRWPWITDLTTTSLVDGHFHHIAAVTENGRGGCTGDIGGSCRAGPNVVRLFVDGVMEATISLGDLPGTSGHVMQPNWFYFGCSAQGACIHEGSSSPTLQDFAAVTLHSMRASSSVRYTNDFAPPPVFAKDASTTILFNVNEGSGNKLHDEGNPETTATIEGATWSCQQPPSTITTTTTTTTSVTTAITTTRAAVKSIAKTNSDASAGEPSVNADDSLDNEGERESSSDNGVNGTASTSTPSSAGTIVGIVLPLLLIISGIVAYVVLRKRERARQRTLTRGGRRGHNYHHDRDEQVHTNQQYNHDSGNDSDTDTAHGNATNNDTGGGVYSNHEVHAHPHNNQNDLGQPAVPQLPPRQMDRDTTPAAATHAEEYAVPDDTVQRYRVPLETGGVVYAVSGEESGGARHTEPVAETGYSKVTLEKQAVYIAGAQDGDYEAVSTYATPQEEYASLGAGQANTYDSSA